MITPYESKSREILFPGILRVFRQCGVIRFSGSRSDCRNKQTKTKANKIMKTLIPTPKTLVMTLTMLALAGLIALPVSASAQVKGAGAAKLTRPAATEVSPSAPAGNDAAKMAMGCASCRVTFVSIKGRPAKTGTTPESQIIARNECPDCVNTIVTSGTGKQAKNLVAHACKKCGSEGMVCCAKK